jgi:hypothetical protein
LNLDKWQVKVKLDLAKKVRKKSSNHSKCKFIIIISSNRKAPPPPMLKDSSEFQTIVSAGTNLLDQIYKASKQKELEEPQNPLSRAYEDHSSTRLRSRSPPAHSGGYSSSRHRSRSPGPRQASIDHSGGNGSLSQAYDEHRLRQVYSFWRFLTLLQFFGTALV